MACFAIRTIKPFMTSRVLRTVYFSYFHSIMSYGIIFWGTSHLSNNIFKTQKRIIRIITNKCQSDSCRQLYKQLQILTFPVQYIFSLLMFVIKILKFMIGIIASIITYIFLLLTSLWCREKSYIQELKFIITYQHKLNLSRKIANNLNLN